MTKGYLEQLWIEKLIMAQKKKAGHKFDKNLRWKKKLGILEILFSAVWMLSYGVARCHCNIVDQTKSCAAAGPCMVSRRAA